MTVIHAPRMKRTTSWCFPRGPTSKGTWKATKAATHTFSVDGIRPAVKRSWNSSTEATRQLTGSNPCSLPHMENTFHFRPHNLLVEEALELSMVSITPDDKPGQPLGTAPPQGPDPQFPQFWPRDKNQEEEGSWQACQQWHDVWDPYPGWPERGYQQ